MGLIASVKQYFDLKSKKFELENKSLELETKMLDEAMTVFNTKEGSVFARTTDRDESKWETIGTPMGSTEISETNLDNLRSATRLAWETDPLANNIIESSVDFVTGRGVNLSLSKLDDDKYPSDRKRKKLKEDVIEYWEAFKKVNDFDGNVPEFSRRIFRDGEFFIRWFEPDGKFSNEADIENAVPRIRFLEPARIKDASGNIEHGIETDKEDYTKILWYYLVDDNGNHKEKIPAEEITHLKIRSDSNCKRGRSILFPVLKHLKYYEQWLKYRLILNKVRTAIVLVRTVKGGPTAVANLRSDRASTTSLKSTKAQMLEPGTIITTQEGIDYKFMAPQLDARDAASDGREIKLSIAAGVGFPEMLITSDFSNNTYSSSLTAQNPMIRKFQSWQTFFGHFYQTIFERVIENGINHWTLPSDCPNKCDIEFAPMIHRELKDETSAYQMAHVEKAMSRKTFAEKLGLNWEQEVLNMKDELTMKDIFQQKIPMEKDKQNTNEDLFKKGNDKKVDTAKNKKINPDNGDEDD